MIDEEGDRQQITDRQRERRAKSPLEYPAIDDEALAEIASLRRSAGRVEKFRKKYGLKNSV